MHFGKNGVNLGVCEEFTTKHSRKIGEVDSLLLEEEEEIFHIVFSSQIRSVFYQGKPSEIKILWILTRPPNDWQQAIVHETEVPDHKAHL